jgi:glutamate racemase
MTTRWPRCRTWNCSPPPAPGSWDFVEAGITSGPEILALAREYLAPLQDAEVDTLILGCTHYPLLTGVLGYVLGDGVTMVSSAEESAKEVFTTLTDLGLVHERPRPVTRRFLTTGSPAMFEGVGRRLMGGFVEGVEQVAPATLRA